jgi:hypothetical protein
VLLLADLKHLTADELGLALRAADPAAFLMEPRVLRRVIRADRQIYDPLVLTPRVEGYMISRSRLLDCADPLEVGLFTADDLPQEVLLFARPKDTWFLEISVDQALLVFWRRLFGLRIQTALQGEVRRGRLELKGVRERIATIGQAEFDEIRGVLGGDRLLIPPVEDVAVYIAFAARFLELHHFAPWLLPMAFPGLRDLDAVEHLLRRDVDHVAIHRATRLPNAPEGPFVPTHGHAAHYVGDEFDAIVSKQDLEEAADGPSHAVPLRASESESTAAKPAAPASTLERRAERARRRAQYAQAAVIQMSADLADHALEGRSNGRAQSESPWRGSRAWDDVNRLVQHLRPAIGLSVEDIDDWADALMPVVHRAAEVNERYSPEYLLLGDLQQLVRDFEQRISQIDLLEWILWRGRLPLWRDVPQQRPILITQDLESASRRLPALRLEDRERNRLAELLQTATRSAEHHVRDALRPSVMDAFRVVGFKPRNLPEEVAYHKLVSELLDQLVERGYLSFTQIRDAVGRNDLKISDLDHWTQFWTGDRLLKLDRELAIHLDGVYRRAEVYLRLQHSLSSLAFGTPSGRFFMRYAFLPFGGGVAILGFIDYLTYKLGKWFGAGHHDDHAHSTDLAAHAGQSHDSDSEAHDVAAATTEPVPESAAAPETAEVASTEPPSADETAVVDNPMSLTAGEYHEPQPLDVEEKIGDPSAPVFDAPADPDKLVAVAEQPEAASAMVEFAGGDHHATAWMTPLNVAIFGMAVIVLMNMPTVRQFCGSLLRGTLKLLWRSLIELPKELMSQAVFARFGDGEVLRAVMAVVARPLAVLLPIWFVAWLLGYEWTGSVVLFLAGFLLLAALLNNRPIRDLEERGSESLAVGWQRFSGATTAALVTGVLDFFKWISDRVEATIFNVENWLRLRSGDSAVAVIVKPVVGVFWAVITYVLRFIWVVLGEPQVNPIKHFPVVTVSHKLLFPVLLAIAASLYDEANPSWNVIVGWGFFFTQLLLPGAMGFLIWELKENWRLYESNRSPSLKPSPVGHHGETVVRLLRPGFHSGTVPKLFSKIRRAAENSFTTGDLRPARMHQSKLHEVEHAVAEFVDRELNELLIASRQWPLQSPRIEDIELSTNRIRIGLLAPKDVDDSRTLWLHFEEQSGWLVANIEDRGWLDSLDEGLQNVFAAALAGWYKRAGVHLVREQIEAHIQAAPTRYDIGDRGLIIWPSGDYDAEVIYDLTKRWRIAPETRGVGPGTDYPVVAARQIVFTRTQLAWTDWVELWSKPIDTDAVHRLLDGVRILPDAASPEDGRRPNDSLGRRAPMASVDHDR